ncbi:hypothetical protein F8M41_019982 [Gigaspora margarita]|uniref:Uncharacterized protein n=1 Tax=Gigaspora margarita TaxID=4874 RepID=A0A8H4AJ47_GIGMA|nr:hypothetical protein F8M41_019982 [Gigaspora margarita]
MKNERTIIRLHLVSRRICKVVNNFIPTQRINTVLGHTWLIPSHIIGDAHVSYTCAVMTNITREMKNEPAIVRLHLVSRRNRKVVNNSIPTQRINTVLGHTWLIPSHIIGDAHVSYTRAVMIIALMSLDVVIMNEK